MAKTIGYIPPKVKKPKERKTPNQEPENKQDKQEAPAEQ